MKPSARIFATSAGFDDVTVITAPCGCSAATKCHYCVYFHTAAARLNGASEEEIREAIAMAAITRHWSTVLNGSLIDEEEFREQTDGILKFVEEQMAATQ